MMLLKYVEFGKRMGVHEGILAEVRAHAFKND